MRLLRKFGVLSGVVALAVVGLPAVAEAAGPTAPYVAFTANGPMSYTFDSSNANFTLIGDRNHFDLSAFAKYDEQRVFATVAAPKGQPLGVGTFATTETGDATHYKLNVSTDSPECFNETGSLTIHELAFDPSTNEIMLMAATYQTNCDGWAGEIRWHSSMPYVDGVQSPSSVDFGDIDLGYSAPAQTVTITGSGSSELKLGTVSMDGATPGAFTIVSNTCTDATLAYGQSCAIGVTGRPVKAWDQFASITVSDNTALGKRTIRLRMNGRINAQGTYTPVSPSRLLDTREGNGAPKAPLGPGQTMHLQVTARGGVPITKVSAVVLNVTVTAPTSAGYLTVYPTGVTRPTASSLNFPAGWTGANSITVPLGANGQIDIFNAAGNVHVIADVMGFYFGYDAAHFQRPAGQYWASQPERLLDSRDPEFGGPLGPFEYVKVPVSYGAKFNPYIRALAVNITAVTPTLGGYVTAWNGVDAPPVASTLNFTKGSVVPNFAVVPTAWCFECGGNGYPSIGVGNFSGGSTHIVVDIFGFYDDGQVPGGLRFHPLTPTRIVDTREGLGADPFTGTATKTVATPATVAGDNTYALVTNVTGVNPSNSTYLSLWAAGDTKPTVSNLNLTPHEVRPNAAFVNVGPGNTFNVFNAAWNVDVVIDVSGTFEYVPELLASAQGGGVARLGPLRADTTGTPQRLTVG